MGMMCTSASSMHACSTSTLHVHCLCTACVCSCMLILQLLQSPEDWSHITELVHEPGLRLQALCARSSVARIGTGDRPRARRMGRFWRHDLLAMQSQSRELGTQRACVCCCKPSTQRAMHARHAHHALMQGVSFFAHTMEVYNGYDAHKRD